jgi:hypothetical protein
MYHHRTSKSGYLSDVSALNLLGYTPPDVNLQNSINSLIQVAAQADATIQTNEYNAHISFRTYLTNVRPQIIAIRDNAKLFAFNPSIRTTANNILTAIANYLK